MRRTADFLIFFVLIGIGAVAGASLASNTVRGAQAQNPHLSNPQKATPATQPAQAASQTNPQPNPQPPPQGLHVVVLDAAHGGTDTGARGPGGATEKDMLLEFARLSADALRAQGFQVIETRRGDSDPSLDDRATIANAQTNAIYISLHLGSSGRAGTVRTYTYLFPSMFVAQPGDSPAAASSPSAAFATALQSRPLYSGAPAAFLPWREAQKPFLAQSGKLAGLLQIQLALKFKDSPEISSAVPVAGLRSVAAPAVAIEISNMSLDQQSLENMAPDFAAALAQGVTAYRAIYPPGGK